MKKETISTQKQMLVDVENGMSAAIEEKANIIVAQKMKALEEQHNKEYKKRLEGLQNRQNMKWVQYLAKSTVIPLFALIFALVGITNNHVFLADVVATGKMLIFPFVQVLNWQTSWWIVILGCLLIGVIYAAVIAGLGYWTYQFLGKNNRDYNDLITQITFFSVTAIVIFFGNTLGSIPFVNLFVFYITILTGYSIGRTVHGNIA